MDVEAYTAGLIDADGCITISKPTRTRFQLVVVLAMTDRGPLDLVAEHFGGEVRSGKVTRTGRVCWQWSKSGYGAQEFLEQVRPWLVAKAPQADLAFAYPVGARGVTHKHYPPEHRQLQESLYAAMKRVNRKE